MYQYPKSPLPNINAPRAPTNNENKYPETYRPSLRPSPKLGLAGFLHQHTPYPVISIHVLVHRIIARERVTGECWFTNKIKEEPNQQIGHLVSLCL